MAGEMWTEAELAEVIDVKHGFAFKGEFFRDSPPGDILLTPGNFSIGGGFKYEKLKYYNGPVPDEYVLSEGDLLVTMTDLSKAADTLGYPAIVPAHDGRHARYLHNQRLGLVAIKAPEKLKKLFLYYVMCNNEYRDEIIAGATGTTVKHTSPKKIKGYLAKLPPVEEQRAIADILGTLDKKIELNRQMNSTLEAMARAIFKAWFVDFEPVKAKAAGATSFRGIPQPVFDQLPDRFTDSELGPVPEGWEVMCLEDLAEINPRRTLKKGELAPYISMSNMPTRGHSPETWEMREFGSGMRFVNGDTLVARITPCLENGKTAFVDVLPEDVVGWGSTEYIVLRPKRPFPNVYAYCLARLTEFRDFAIKNMTGTSGRQRVPASSLARFKMVKPSESLAENFGETVVPLFEMMAANYKQMRTLASIRDTLLPKLISGELRVSVAEGGADGG